MKTTRGLSGSSSPSLDAFLLTAASWASQAITVVTLVLCARFADYATFSGLLSALALATILVALTDFGLNSMWLIQLSNGTLTSRTWMLSATTKIIWGVLVTSIGLLLGFILNQSIVVEISLLYLSQLTQQTVSVYMKVSDTNKRLALSMLIDRLCVLGTTTIIFLGIDSNRGLFWGFVIGPLVASAFMLPSLPFKELRGNGKWFVANVWRGSRFFGALSILGAFRTLDVPLLTFTNGVAAGAVYGAVSRWIQPIILAATQLGTVTTPIVARKGLTKSLVEVKGPVIVFSAALFLVVCMAVFPQALVQIILGSNYEASAELLRWNVMSGVFLAIATVLSAWLQAVSAEKMAALTSGMFLATGLVFGVLTSGAFGPLGMAMSLCAGNFLLALVQFLLLRRLVKH